MTRTIIVEFSGLAEYTSDPREQTHAHSLTPNQSAKPFSTGMERFTFYGILSDLHLFIFLEHISLTLSETFFRLYQTALHTTLKIGSQSCLCMVNETPPPRWP